MTAVNMADLKSSIMSHYIKRRRSGHMRQARCLEAARNLNNYLKYLADL
jgi:hypothetical protein